MKNPNEYNDDAYTAASIQLSSAVTGLWAAGASVENIEEELNNALENATEQRVAVTVEVLP